MKLKTLRKSKGLSQCEIASLLGISQPHYFYYESGRAKNMPDKIELMLSDIFNIEFQYSREEQRKCMKKYQTN